MLLPVLFAAFAFAGCSAQDSPDGPLTRERLAKILRNRGLDPSHVVLPYGLTQEMREWAHLTAPATVRPEMRLDLLRRRLLDADEMSVIYTWGYTGTAIEVFEKRQANCLAFTNLFLAMAREVGVPVYFMAVENVETYRKEGDLVVISDHIAVGYGENQDVQVFDFSENPPEDPRFVRRISDLTAVAMFHSNRGAEALQAGHVPEAVRWLRTSVGIDPRLANAWVNLGVAERRSRNLEAAESAYKKALELDARVYSAYHNLSSLLRALDREEEAVGYEQTLARVPNQNPYTYLSLGDVSLRGGRLKEAERFYRKAANLGRDDPECFAALGQLAAANGDLKLARRMLRKALEAESDARAEAEAADRGPRLVRLEEVLTRLDSGGASGLGT
ncbi:MAG: tetratricopeptide repeat protein [Acidobacteriota bacterium]